MRTGHLAGLLVTDALVRDIATETDTHDRSVVRILAGLPVRGGSGRRIKRALEARGFALITNEAPPKDAA